MSLYWVTFKPQKLSWTQAWLHISDPLFIRFSLGSPMQMIHRANMVTWLCSTIIGACLCTLRQLWQNSVTRKLNQNTTVVKGILSAMFGCNRRFNVLEFGLLHIGGFTPEFVWMYRTATISCVHCVTMVNPWWDYMTIPLYSCFRRCIVLQLYSWQSTSCGHVSEWCACMTSNSPLVTSLMGQKAEPLDHLWEAVCF